MNELEILRNQIDGIDDDIRELLALRIKTALDIGAYKKENGIKIEQLGREDAIFMKNLVAANEHGVSSEYFNNVFKTMIDEAKKAQVETYGE